MHVNRVLIGKLRRVDVSSIVKWGYEDNFKPVYFFVFTKRFHVHKKHRNVKQMTFTLLEVFQNF